MATPILYRDDDDFRTDCGYRIARVIGLLAAAVLVHVMSADADGAIIRLKSEVACQSALLQLGDVADVVAANEPTRRELERAPLGLAPGVGKARFLGVDEVKSQLRRRGVNLVEHEFLGASRVKLLGPSSAAGTKVARAQTIAPTSREQTAAERNLQTAVRRFLAQHGAADAAALVITVEIPAAIVETVARLNPDRLIISGGNPPWRGRQVLNLLLSTDLKDPAFSFTAEVSLPQQVVVARRRVPRGLAIQADDVELRRLEAGDRDSDVFRRLDEVIGKEAMKTLEPGEAVAARDVQAIPLVRRGEVVSVLVRGPGFVVKRLARSRDEAAQGDTVALVTLEDRKQFLGVVVGLREVEVPWRGERQVESAP